MLLGKISKIKSEIKSPSIPLLPESEWIAKTRSTNRDGELEREKGCVMHPVCQGRHYVEAVKK